MKPPSQLPSSTRNGTTPRSRHRSRLPSRPIFLRTRWLRGGCRLGARGRPSADDASYALSARPRQADPISDPWRGRARRRRRPRARHAAHARRRTRLACANVLHRRGRCHPRGLGADALPGVSFYLGRSVLGSFVTLSIVEAYAAKLPAAVDVERTSRAPEMSDETPRSRTTFVTCVMPRGCSV